MLKRLAISLGTAALVVWAVGGFISAAWLIDSHTNPAARIPPRFVEVWGAGFILTVIAIFTVVVLYNVIKWIYDWVIWVIKGEQ